MTDFYYRLNREAAKAEQLANMQPYCHNCLEPITHKIQSRPGFCPNSNSHSGLCKKCRVPAKKEEISSEKRSEVTNRPVLDCRLCGKPTRFCYAVCRNCTIDFRNLLKLKQETQQPLDHLDRMFLDKS